MISQMKNRNLTLVHWNESEAEKMASTLREHGWDVILRHSSDQFKMSGLRQNPPAAVVISQR
ncbi:MAG: hypothetical protein A2Z14_12295 [Chloroflexi bacterium RBG_16_48_8]|nr:MAG: hypothetical protein A2Z14_12295 [Chloroflexi bacterium RBG_16_48_8]